MVEGFEVYNANRAACHQADGKGVPGAFPQPSYTLAYG